MNGKIAYLDDLSELHRLASSVHHYIVADVLNAQTSLLGKLQPRYVDAYIMIYVNEGWLEMSIDYTPWRVDRHRLLLMEPRLLSEITSFSDDFQAYCIIVNRQFFLDVVEHQPILPHVGEARHYIVSPDDPRQTIMMHAFRIIQQCIYKPNQSNAEICRNALRILQINFSELISENQIPQLSFTHAEIIFRHFIELLAENFKTEHKIGFYADRLNISTTYLSRIVKDISSNTVKDFIADLLFSEAKHELRHTDITINELSDKFCFANPSAFIKFFVQKEGTTPDRYRRKLHDGRE